jgi:ParB-like chromosome segregation protein Spo0J
MTKEDKAKLDAGAKEIRSAKAAETEAERQARLQAEHAKQLLEEKTAVDKIVRINGMMLHPLASEFPMLTAKEYKELKADIEVNGIKFPILVNKKKDTIYDGRTRYLIAMELGFKGKKIPMDIWEGKEEDVAKEIISRNILRRHLSPDQRVGIVTKLRAPQLEKEAAERRDAARKTKGSFGGNKEVKGSVAAHIAKETQVSQHKAEQALKARKAGLLEDVIVGTRPLRSASKKVATKKRAKKVIPFEDVVWAKWKKFLNQFALDQKSEVRRIVRGFCDLKRDK